MESKHPLFRGGTTGYGPSIVPCTPVGEEGPTAAAIAPRHVQSEVHKTEIEWRLEAPVLDHDLLQYKCVLDGAWPVPCLSEAFKLCYFVLWTKH